MVSLKNSQFNSMCSPSITSITRAPLSSRALRPSRSSLYNGCSLSGTMTPEVAFSTCETESEVRSEKEESEEEETYPVLPQPRTT